MKKITSIIIFALLSLTLITSISAKVSEGESLINPNAQFKSKTLKSAIGKFAESASKYHKKHRVVLSTQGHSINKYKGSVYIRHTFRGKFRKYSLPQPKNTWSVMEPMTIFFANADSDADNELLIIERNMTGIGPMGSRYFYRTRVYDWNGRGFRHLEKISEKIGAARTPARVKVILKRLLENEKPAKYQKINPADFNRKVRIAARNREFWVKMPTLVAANFAGAFSETKKRTVEIISPSAESSRSLEVILTDDGIADESVRSVQYKLKLRVDSAGIWYVTTAGKAQRCWQGRGHQDYSSAPCI
jgi:hypothetical protein